MKRFILVLLLVLSASGLFAKDKIIFQKKSKYSQLEFIEVSDIEKNNGFRYMTVVNEAGFNDEWLLYIAVSNDYDKLQDFTIKMYQTGNKLETALFSFYFDYYATLNNNLTLDYEKTKIDNNQIVKYKVYILE